MSSNADALAAVISTLIELPLRLARVEAQQREILDRLDALAAAAPPALVTVEAAVERLGLSAATIRRQLAAGELPGVRLAGRWRVDLAAVGRRTRPEHDEIGRLAVEARGRG